VQQQLHADLRELLARVQPGPWAAPVLVERPTAQALALQHVYATPTTGKPEVLLSVLYQGTGTGQGWTLTAVQVGTGTPKVTHETAVWTPAKTDRAWIELPGPPPAGDRAERLRQLQSHTEQLQCKRNGTELRRTASLRDYDLPLGRVIGFCENGVLQAFAVVEVQTAAEGATWQTQLLALGSGEIELSHGERALLSAPAERPNEATAPVYQWRAAGLTELAALGGWQQPGPLGGWAFTHDSRVLASAGADGVVQLRVQWRDANVLPVPVPTGTEPVVALQFSPGGAFLATADAKGTLRLWDANLAVQTGQAKSRDLPAHPAGWRCLAFSPDGQSLAAGGADGVVKWFDPANGAVLHTLHATKHTIAALAFSPDSQTLAIAADALTLVTVETGAVVRTLPIAAQGIAFLPNGTLLAHTANDGGIWDTSTGQLVRLVPALTGTRSFALDAKGTRLATVRTDGSVRVWQLASGQLLGRCATPDVRGVLFAPTGGTLLTASATGQVRQWEVPLVPSK
jgi:WD40 repeat protein